MKTRWTRLAAALLSAITIVAPSAGASVVAIGPFAASTSITFTGIADGTEVNGLGVSGVLFSYSLGNGQLTIDGGPGITNNVAPPNIVSIGNATGILTMILPAQVTAFGYGYAILESAPVANATTISLFSGATPVGSLSYAGVLDPVFAGGFAGISSTIPFDRVAVSFAAAPAFALDNIRIAAIPEPSSMLLVAGGLVAALCRFRRGRKS